ncbi:inositol monophosphatase family protein [Cohaesibacter celericrescens]|uniref:inositol monophosphatase family protein n=1 Tax=Cohaesibacter celericrescens TaxID=2067669 RepID=UPI00356A0D8F
MNKEINNRLEFAKDTARKAGALGMTYFADIGNLNVEQKGVQDLVSNADKDVELFVRAAIAERFPKDGIVGEEHANVDGTSGYTWVIDPIDGTANFLTSIPAWCVIIACVHDDKTKIAAIFDPCHNEMFSGSLDGGAYLNDKPMKVAETTGLDAGNLGVGINGRTDKTKVVRFIDDLASRGGIFFRNSSGGLMLSYVAAGRLIGYAEPHMNAWDCLAAQLLILEAGGRIEKQSANDMLEHGGRVITSTPIIFDEIVAMADAADF